VVEHAIEFEWNWFRDDLEDRKVSVALTRTSIDEAYERLRKTLSEKSQPSPTIITLNYVYIEALLHLIHASSILADSNPTVPETFRMDVQRLQTFRNDWQDITIMATLLILYKQISGPKCNSQHLKAMKNTLWVLLNDADTGIQHIVLELARGAGTIKGTKMSDAEIKVLNGLVERTLSPESKLYIMVGSRVGEHVKDWLEILLDSAPVKKKTEPENAVSSSSSTASTPVSATVPSKSNGAAGSTQSKSPILDKSKIAKHGLTDLEEELRDLAERVGKFAEFNRAVYFEIYTEAYERAKEKHT
jgi:hypothetical protein